MWRVEHPATPPTFFFLFFVYECVCNLEQRGMGEECKSRGKKPILPLRNRGDHQSPTAGCTPTDGSPTATAEPMPGPNTPPAADQIPANPKESSRAERCAGPPSTGLTPDKTPHRRPYTRLLVFVNPSNKEMNLQVSNTQFLITTTLEKR